MTTRFNMTNLDPTVKQYRDMRREERDYVRMQGESIADRIVAQYSGKPFLLRVIAAKIEAEARTMEPQPEQDSGEKRFGNEND